MHKSNIMWQTVYFLTFVTGNVTRRPRPSTWRPNWTCTRRRRWRSRWRSTSVPSSSRTSCGRPTSWRSLMQQLHLHATEEELEKLKEEDEEEEEEKKKRRSCAEMQRNGLVANQEGAVQSAEVCKPTEEESVREESGGDVQGDFTTMSEPPKTEQDCDTLENGVGGRRWRPDDHRAPFVTSPVKHLDTITHSPPWDHNETEFVSESHSLMQVCWTVCLSLASNLKSLVPTEVTSSQSVLYKQAPGPGSGSEALWSRFSSSPHLSQFSQLNQDEQFCLNLTREQTRTRQVNFSCCKKPSVGKQMKCVFSRNFPQKCRMTTFKYKTPLQPTEMSLQLILDQNQQFTVFTERSYRICTTLTTPVISWILGIKLIMFKV